MQRLQPRRSPKTPGVRPSGGVRVRLVTTAGDIVIELATDRAPSTAEAFLHALDEGALADIAFTRAVRRDNDQGRPAIEVVQTMPARISEAQTAIPHESTDETGLTHCDGALSLARAADGANTPGAFFICIGDQPCLDFGGARNPDGLGYAVFGHVVSGMDVARAIHRGKTRPDAPDPYLVGQLLEEPVAVVSVRREAEAPSERLRDLADDYWGFRLREYTAETFASGDRRHDTRLSGARITDHDRRALLAGGFLARARDIPADALSPEEAVTWRLLVEQASTIVEAWELNDHLTPKLFPLGFPEILAYMAGAIPLITRDDFEHFLLRLDAVADFFRGHLETLQAALDRGYRLPRALATRVRALVEAQLDDGGIVQSVRARFANCPAGIDATAFETLARRAEATLDQTVKPALAGVLAFLDAHSDNLYRPTISICDQPNGTAYYRFRIRQQTSRDLDPDDLHQAGREEVERLDGEVRSLLEEVGFAGDGATYSAHLADTGIEPTAERLLERARAVAKRIDGELPRFFGRLPRVTYAVRSFSPEQSQHNPIGMAQPAPADRSLAGVFWITAAPARCPTHLLTSLSLHEAWPGHLMQFAISHELEDLPMFRRQSLFEYNAYIEGWALYCERLGFEMGLYADPRDRFGCLANDLWRAARLVVDTGIHWKGWSREEAIDYMTRTCFLPRETVEAEVDRYIGMPAQALSYKVGERAIRALRAEAEAALGPAFSLRAFHDVVLETGPVSLGVLEAHVRAWIERETAAARSQLA